MYERSEASMAKYPQIDIYPDGTIISKLVNRPLVGGISSSGHRQVAVFDASINKTQTVRVHNLVADAFLPNPHNLKFVMFRDGNKLNPTSDNLYRSNTYLQDRVSKGFIVFDKTLCVGWLCEDVIDVSIIAKVNLTTVRNLKTDKPTETQNYAIFKDVGQKQIFVGGAPYKTNGFKRRKLSMVVVHITNGKMHVHDSLSKLADSSGILYTTASTRARDDYARIHGKSLSDLLTMSKDGEEYILFKEWLNDLGGDND